MKIYEEQLDLNSAVDLQTIYRHLKIPDCSTDLQDFLHRIAVKLNDYEQKALGLQHALDLKEKALSRQLGLV